MNRLDNIDLVISKTKNSMFWECPCCPTRITLSPADQEWAHDHVEYSARRQMNQCATDRLSQFKIALWYTALSSNGRWLKPLGELKSKTQRKARLQKIYDLLMDDEWADLRESELFAQVSETISEYLEASDSRLQMITYDAALESIGGLAAANE